MVTPCSHRQARYAPPRAVALRPTLTAAARGADPDFQVGTMNGIAKKAASNDARLLVTILLNLTHTTVRIDHLRTEADDQPRSSSS